MRNLERILGCLASLLLVSLCSADFPVLGWVTRLNIGPLSVSSRIIAQDTYGECFIASRAFTAKNATNIYVTKLDAYGSVKWTRLIAAPYLASVNGLVIDTNGIAYVQVTKYTSGSSNTEIDEFGFTPTGMVSLYKANKFMGSAVGLGVGVDAHNDLCAGMSVPTIKNPFTNDFLGIVFSPTGGIIVSKEDPAMNPSACVFGRDGTFYVTGAPRLGPNTSLSAYFARYNAQTLAILNSKTVTGLSSGGNQTGYTFYCNVDPQAPGDYFLATSQVTQGINPISAQSDVAEFGPNGMQLWVSPWYPMATYFMVNNGQANVQMFGLNYAQGGTTYVCVNKGKTQFSTNGYNFLSVAPESNGNTFVAEGSGPDVHIQEIDNKANTVGNIQTVTATGSNPAAGATLSLQQCPAFYNALALFCICDLNTHDSVYEPTACEYRGGAVFESVTTANKNVKSGENFTLTVVANEVTDHDIPVALTGVGVSFVHSSVVIPKGQQSIQVTCTTKPTNSDIQLSVTGEGSGVKSMWSGTEDRCSIASVEVPASALRTALLFPVTINLNGKAAPTPIKVTSSNQAVIANTTITIDEGLETGQSFISIEQFSGHVDKTVTLTFTDPSGGSKTATITIKAN